MKVIFNTLIKALPALANAGYLIIIIKFIIEIYFEASLIALMLFIFAILGMNLFCYVRPSEGLDY